MIYIYSPSENIQRLDYIARHLFKSILGIDYSIVRDKNAFRKQNGACINYSDENLYRGLWIVPQGLLFEKGIRKISDLGTAKWKEYFCFFRQNRGDIPFDLFAASFYLLTLYEEYFPKLLDEHGRFNPNESLIYKNDLLEIPLIDRWAYLLKEEIEKKYPGTIFNKREFRFISTIDVDHPYKYLNKGIIKTGGKIMQDLLHRKFKGILARLTVCLRMQPDPYMAILKWLDRVHKKTGKSYYLFALMKDRGKYGRKTIFPPTAYYRYLRNLKTATVGLHPSYDTYHNYKQLITEKKRLEKALKTDELLTSRQHFLRMAVPETFRYLEAAGFEEDFTIAFARAPGFRSGTAVPHYFYDIEKDVISKLLLHPTTVMDATLITHLYLSPEAALEKIKHLIDECKQSGGDFVSLWHNSNLADNGKNNSWQKVFIEMFRYAVSLENDTFVS